MPRCKSKPLPPGVYNVTLQTVRKVRNKNAVKLTFVTEDGRKVTGAINYDPAKGDGQ